VAVGVAVGSPVDAGVDAGVDVGVDVGVDAAVGSPVGAASTLGASAAEVSVTSSGAPASRAAVVADWTAAVSAAETTTTGAEV
jgi:hypothetical protein